MLQLELAHMINFSIPLGSAAALVFFVLGALFVVLFAAAVLGLTTGGVGPGLIIEVGCWPCDGVFEEDGSWGCLGTGALDDLRNGRLAIASMGCAVSTLAGLG